MILIKMKNNRIFNLDRLLFIYPNKISDKYPNDFWAVFGDTEDTWVPIDAEEYSWISGRAEQ